MLFGEVPRQVALLLGPVAASRLIAVVPFHADVVLEREVTRQVGLSLGPVAASRLRAGVPFDADVVLVGEVRRQVALLLGLVVAVATGEVAVGVALGKRDARGRHYC